MNKILARTLCAFSLLASQQLFAQAMETAVPVEQEPRHRVVFQNKNVRIYDALIPPGDLSLFHTHSFDNVFVVVSGGKGTNEVHGKPPTQTAPVTGAAGFARVEDPLHPPHRKRRHDPSSLRCRRGARPVRVRRRPGKPRGRTRAQIGAGK